MRHLWRIVFAVCCVPPSALAQTPGPRLFFSDLTSGPNTGGENGAGAFVTVRGLGLGSSQGSSRVTIGGGAAASYRAWSDTRIVFQLGPAAQTGSIVVETANGASGGLPFIVRAGALYFVATTGNDSAAGTFAAPWRTLVKAKNTIAPGDVAYARDGVSETGEDDFGASLSIETSGQPGLPKAIVAYPGATVTVGSTAPDRLGIRVPNIGIAATDWVFAGLLIRGETSAIEIGGTGSARWRVVNDDISCPVGDGQTGCFVASQARDIDFLGNDVHDISTQLGPLPSKQYHAVYFTTDTNRVRVGWNHIHDNDTCRAVQFHSSPLCAPGCGPGDTTGFNQYDLIVHDNLIHGDTCDGINFATVNPAQGPVEAYNNVIYRVGRGPDPPDGSANYAGIHVAGATNTGADGTGNVNVYDNTLYDCGAQGSSDAGAFTRGGGSPGLRLVLRNNVVYAVNGEAYVGGSSTTALITGTNNLWFGSGVGPSYLGNNVNADPRFVSLPAHDFHVQPGSPAVDAGVSPAPASDHDGVPRPQGSGLDLGAYEFPATVCAITIEPATLPTGTVGQVYAQTFTQSGGAPPVAFSITGTLPAGVSFNPGSAVLSGVPSQAGVFVITVSATDANDCSASRVYNLAISSALAITATALAVDAAGNSVFEPGETVVLDPTWRNGTGGIVTLTGTVSSFIGPPGAAYSISDATASYGTIAPGASARCSTATGDCYSVAVGAASRPAMHWDASVAESLSSGGPRAWTLHLGESFSDVPRTDPFYRFIETLFHRGVTAGCGSSPPRYCPASAVTRAQMAVFVLVAREGPGYSPAACVAGSETFADVPAASGFCRWIEELSRRSVVSGCGGGSYCPNDAVSRAQMAVFVLRTLEPGLTPPPCTSGAEAFADVPATSGFCRWIEELARRGVVSGCGGGNYCPDAPVSRGQMGVFIGATFGLTLYGP